LLISIMSAAIFSIIGLFVIMKTSENKGS
jgi:hypothetical protein